jgi:hypothetical protein
MDADGGRGLMSLLDADVIARSLTHDAPWCDSHGASGEYLGAGLIYYTLVYALRADLAVCLGSGGGFVPRLMRQAQRDAGIAECARTVLVDGNVPEAGWGAPQWLEPDSAFRADFPDVELVLQRTDEAAQTVFAAEQAEIGYLHIDADHSHAGCLDDFIRYRPFLRPGSLVTLHDTNLAGAGVKYVLEQLRARADCDLIDLVDAGTGVALLRITADDPRPRTVLGQGSAVTITRRPDAPQIEPPMLQWRYLRSEAFSVRNVLAAHFVRDCPTVIEIGGWETPIDRYLTGAHDAVVVVDPLIRDATRDGHGGTVHHVRARFQDLEWHVSREREYGLVILGLDLEGLTAEDESELFGLIDGAKAVVIEFPTSWEPSREQYARMRASTNVEEHVSTALDFGGNDFGDLTNSWPPRVERQLRVLRPPHAPILARPDDGGTLFGEPWRRLLAGERDGWEAHGGDWRFDAGGVNMRSSEEWASLEWHGGLTDLARGTCFSIELTVMGDADAAGISFGSYRDLLARGPGTHHLRVDIDSGANTWSLSVDGQQQRDEWWGSAIGSARDLLGGRLTLKARHAADVRFSDLAIHERDGACLLSVVLTCSRFLQRMRLGLRTWCAQDMPSGTLEVLIVNPESPDGTAEHLGAVARSSRHVQVNEIRVPRGLATNKGAMINRALDQARGACVWITDADCLFPPHAAREALRQAQAAPRHLYYLRRHHLSSSQTDALLAGSLEPVRDFDHLSATLPATAPEDHAPWGYTQLLPRTAATEIRYREDINHFAHSDEIFIAFCRQHGYPPRALDGLRCLHLEHPFAWNGTPGFL